MVCLVGSQRSNLSSTEGLMEPLIFTLAGEERTTTCITGGCNGYQGVSNGWDFIVLYFTSEQSMQCNKTFIDLDDLFENCRHQWTWQLKTLHKC